LYSHDEDPDNTELRSLIKQSLKLIALMPTIISYGYQAKSHYFDKQSLYIHKPKASIGTAGNILHMIRPDNKYTEKEKEVLDLLLVIHAEHGGGNNSTFTTSVISSTGTDTYSAISAAVGSLKGPKHGGANLRVAEMIDEIKIKCDYNNEIELNKYLEKILNKEAFDKSGLIYGMGHAVYTKSDPRASLLKQQAYELAVEKDRLDDYKLYSNIEAFSKLLFKGLKGDSFIISANTDLYACLVYELLGMPRDLYTPLFATARISGWCAHRIEQILSDPKILRPAYAFVDEIQPYHLLNERK
jgi:citrate synthase